MVRKAVLASCCLNQWSMDFQGNMERILRSITEAGSHGARFRLGPELEISGYGCEDHFLEGDTLAHCCEVLAQLVRSTSTLDILCEVGMPFEHRHVLYNCRVFFLNGRLLLVRPKLALAGNGNYREARWFTAWTRRRCVEEHCLPDMLQNATGQESVPFGDAYLQLTDVSLAAEVCEELFATDNPHIDLYLNGVDIVTNGSGSHHELRKLHRRATLLREATVRGGGIYMYSNLRGCDGGRLFFDSSAMVAVNGEIVAQSAQFSPNEVEVLTAVVDVDDVRVYRQALRSTQLQADAVAAYPSIKVDFSLCSPVQDVKVMTSQPKEMFHHLPEEEIALGPALWLWDYLRRSCQGGYFLPLSGGVDSTSVACILSSMCRLVFTAITSGNSAVLSDVRRVLRDDAFMPNDHLDLAGHLFTTCYMATSNSSADTRERAEKLAQRIGSHHIAINIDGVVESVVSTVSTACGLTPRYAVHGGSHQENLALQNVQARSRMVLAYAIAQLFPSSVSRKGSLLVLGTANVDEALRGYYTKYDCSAADLNPIGGISKTDLRSFLNYCAQEFNMADILQPILQAAPTAELEPITEDHVQTDEADMGMTYEELSIFGRLRKISRCGPVSMFAKLCEVWPTSRSLSLAEIADKVKHFFTSYAINRHKMTTLTPSYHAEAYSPDDNRFDLRQFLYNVRWPWQFRQIDHLVEADGNMSQIQTVGKRKGDAEASGNSAKRICR